MRMNSNTRPETLPADPLGSRRTSLAWTGRCGSQPWATTRAIPGSFVSWHDFCKVLLKSCGCLAAIRFLKDHLTTFAPCFTGTVLPVQQRGEARELGGAGS